MSFTAEEKIRHHEEEVCWSEDTLFGRVREKSLRYHYARLKNLGKPLLPYQEKMATEGIQDLNARRDRTSR